MNGLLGNLITKPQDKGPRYNIHCQECGGMCLFAEDSTYTKHSKDPAEVKEVMEDKYKVITKWMASNKPHLLLMASKASHRVHQDFNISLNTGFETIQPIKYEKLLGAVVLNDLEWNLVYRLQSDDNGKHGEMNRI